MTKRKRISVEKQCQLRELAAKRQAENQQIAHELKIPIKEIEYCLDRAVVEIKKKKRRHSGFDLFKIDWFKKNQGYKAIDKHTSSLISYEWNAISLAEKNEYARVEELAKKAKKEDEKKKAEAEK
ncbi:1935_t:CDS:2, partial [Rhizophagus irregularis]